MGNTPQGKTIEDVLNKLVAGEIDWVHSELDGTSMVQENLDAIEKDKQVALSEIEALVNKVIGKDGNNNTAEKIIRNKLRAEQRQALTKITRKDK